MTRRRLLLAGGATAAAVGAAALAVPLVTGGYDSATEALLRDLHRRLLVVAVPLALLVQAALFYAAYRFHDNDDPKPTPENRRLELAWTAGVAVILLFVGVSSYLVLAHPMVSTPPDATPPPDAVEVDVVGQNWFWTFSYPGENVTTRDDLVLPANRTVVFRLASEDVVHSMHVPALGVKQDAVPGQTNTYRTRVRTTGTYRLYCAEYCGAGHSKMTATVRVVPPEEYRAWLRRQRGTGQTNGTTDR